MSIFSRNPPPIEISLERIADALEEVLAILTPPESAPAVPPGYDIEGLTFELIESIACPACGGRGTQPCSICNGVGRIPR